MVQASNLFPTSATDPDPAVVAKATLPLDVSSPVRLSAECECAPGTPEAAQFANLAIEVRTPGRAGLDITAKKYYDVTADREPVLESSRGGDLGEQ